MLNSDGTRNSTSRVEASSPNTMLVASGIRTWACRLRSASRGSSPAMVVMDVNNTARKRSRLARRAASLTDAPSCTRSFRNSTSRMESFTTMPARETNPIMLGMDSSRPMDRCPHTTPMKASGMAVITARGSRNDRNWKDSSRKMPSNPSPKARSMEPPVAALSLAWPSRAISMSG